MSEVLPAGCTTSSPRRYSAPPRFPHEGWATCAGRSPGSRLERSLPAFPERTSREPVAFEARARRLQLREQPRNWEKLPLTAFPFHLRPPQSLRRDRHAFNGTDWLWKVNARTGIKLDHDNSATASAPFPGLPMCRNHIDLPAMAAWFKRPRALPRTEFTPGSVQPR